MGGGAVLRATAFCILFASPAFAQSQPFAAPSPGTRLYTSGDAWYEIDSVDGNVVRTVNARLAPATWIGGCAALGSRTIIDQGAVDVLWPLATGKSVSVASRNEQRSWLLNFRVVGPERIAVPAGSFDTWLIEVEEAALSHVYRGIYRCWYAPEVGFIVKRTIDIKEGDGASSKAEVVRIERKDRSTVADFRAPPPGTAFTTTSGVTRIAGAYGTNLVQSVNGEDKKVYWLGGLAQYVITDDLAATVQREMDKLWPLQAGKSVSFEGELPGLTATATPLKFQYDVTVERTETVTVPAGTFSTFVVKWEQSALGQPAFRGVQTLWWSPALGFPVRREIKILQGRTDWTRYDLRAAQAP
jgi:hypothetical protein